MNDFIEKKVKPVAKLWVVIGGAILTSGATLLEDPWSTILAVSIGVATAISTYAVPNTPYEPGD